MQNTTNNKSPLSPSFGRDRVGLFSNIIGEGKPLLILHGYLGMGDNWKTHALNLSKEGYQVHLIDQRNHGRSFHSYEFDYSILVEDLKNYIEQHQLEKTHILGHSMGGKVAMLFAVTYPDLLDKLVVADMSPKSYVGHHNAILKALNSVDFSLQNTRKLVDEKLAEYIPEMGVRGFLCKSLYWEGKEKLNFRFNLKSLTENYEKILVALPNDTSFKGKTLFLGGEKSGYITEEDKSLINSHFPNNKIIEIAKAGHWLHAENPKDFFNELVGFLKE